MSHRKWLNESGTRIDYVAYPPFPIALVLSLLFASSFTIKSSWLSQTKGIDGSVRNTSKVSLLFQAFFEYF